MKVMNVHERLLPAPPERVGALLDALAGPDDRLWPTAAWPAMRFDGPLAPGARGGHGPVRYRVESVAPGRRVVLAFTPPARGFAAGLHGTHRFEVQETASGGTRLRHVLDGRCGPAVWVKWLLVIRPLHDALIEDALDGAERALGVESRAPARWSPWVRILRALVARRSRARGGVADALRDQNDAV